MAVTTIKALLAVGKQVDQALAAASAESATHAAAAQPPTSPAPADKQLAPNRGR